jgi:hypothetical protein
MKRIYEFTEFNAMRLNPDSQRQSIQVDDPAISFDPYNNHLVKSADANKRLYDIAKNVMNTKDFINFVANDRNDLLNISDLKLLRIDIKNSINVNLFISFIYNKETYFAAIYNYNQNPTFKSEFFTNYGVFFTKEFKIKFEGMFLKIFKKWFAVEHSNYKCLKETIVNNIVTGQEISIKPNDIVYVYQTTNTEIFIKLNDIKYKVSGSNYYYFNYYFIKN